MSHYNNVNASVPKTLIQHLIRWVEKNGRACGLICESAPVLDPARHRGGRDQPRAGARAAAVQSTEATVGPYALQDFNLYYRCATARPAKIAFLAWHAWRDAEKGAWPPNFPADARARLRPGEIRSGWMFLWRFFTTSQFKRSAVPNGPKISSGGSLSPRGDWRAPSDGSARLARRPRALGRRRRLRLTRSTRSP